MEVRVSKKRLAETIECGCGCGETIAKYNKWGYKRTYVGGHRARLGNSGQWVKGQEVWNKGKSPDLEYRKKISCTIRGIEVDDFDGFSSFERQLYMNSKEYIDWRKTVFARDDYICQECGSSGCYIQAHHIKPWAEYEDLRFDINNGITLCKDCHMKLHGLNKKEVI